MGPGSADAEHKADGKKIANLEANITKHIVLTISNEKFNASMRPDAYYRNETGEQPQVTPGHRHHLPKMLLPR